MASRVRRLSVGIWSEVCDARMSVATSCASCWMGSTAKARRSARRDNSLPMSALDSSSGNPRYTGAPWRASRICGESAG